MSSPLLHQRRMWLSSFALSCSVLTPLAHKITSCSLLQEVEDYKAEDPYEDEDVDAVATPLRPAYAPASTKAPSGPFRRHKTSTPSYIHALSPSPERKQRDPESPTSGLPFQPILAPPYASVGYYPLGVGGTGSVGPGVVLSRVVQVLEATPPPCLLMPDHPHVPPSPTTIRKAPPVPPNTAHARRAAITYHHSYPSLNKSCSSSTASSPHTVSDEGLSVGGQPRDTKPPPSPS